FLRLSALSFVSPRLRGEFTPAENISHTLESISFSLSGLHYPNPPAILESEGLPTAIPSTVFFVATKRCMCGGAELPVEPLKLERLSGFGTGPAGRSWLRSHNIGW